MNFNINTEYLQKITGLGEIKLRPLLLPNDGNIIQTWVQQDYAKYWGMQSKSLQKIVDYYHSLVSAENENVLLGVINNQPAFLIEYYLAQEQPIAKHYQSTENDIGMHILIAPAINPIKYFSQNVMRFVLSFLFSDPKVERVVVEPDESNWKIHSLNRKVGFIHQKKIQLGKKNAYFASCERKAFFLSNQIFEQSVEKSRGASPQLAVDNITEGSWKIANRLHVKKCISELSHEYILAPEKTFEDNNWTHYKLSPKVANIEYQFRAKKLALNHWLIDLHSLKKTDGEVTVALDSIQFILEFNDLLKIPKDKLATYLEEVSSTLYSSAYKLTRNWHSSDDLAKADFQSIESAMIEGHPAFIANNGRIGFDALDFRLYAPEAATPIQLVWLAAHRSRTHLSLANNFSVVQLYNREFDPTLTTQFELHLKEKNLDPKDYFWLPVHPWQWFNKLSTLFAADIASNHLVCLGFGNDAYQAQQSIRTFYNRSAPNRFYVKTALSILNMGFMRGLSADYMKATPAINDWVEQLINSDQFLKKTGFSILREVAAIGYRNPYSENHQLGNTPYKKMLAALWRESPIDKVNENESTMTMAALVHLDPNNDALLRALISQSNLSVEQWLTQYLNAYLTPLLHCYYQHQLVFMPHGENIILVLNESVPVRVIMKDIGEEVCLLNTSKELPALVQRISIKVPKDEELLSIFTDVFDGFFRYLAAILVEHLDFSDERFWRLVAKTIHEYQLENPTLKDKFNQQDIFAPRFKHSCLNRLQLKNNQQMVDLFDPASSLQYAGHLTNPIAKYKPAAKISSSTIPQQAIEA